MRILFSLLLALAAAPMPAVLPLPSATIGSADSRDMVAYEIDAEHSFVTFKVDRFTMVSVVGSFEKVEGIIEVDAESGEPVTAVVSIPTNSVYLGQSKGRFEAVTSAVFLNVQQHPTITFETRSIEGGVAQGELTINGVTQTVEFPFEFKRPFVDPTGLTTIGIHGELTIDRQDYGIMFSRKLSNGGDFVGNNVEIEINVLAIMID